MLDGQLVGDDGGALAGAVVDDLQQVGAGGRVDGAGAPVVEDKDVGLGQLLQPTAEAARAVLDAQFLRPVAARADAAPSGPGGRRTGPARRPTRSCPDRWRRRR